ncbi:hypothetical protein GCM10007285_16360 [Stappia taiwanensis]|uniref:hypothetical protein n=1 Tax=Stappia taiwanensis TaxID=992267 RepID=UPI0019C979A5|nr:hypothetical protein [Stappia taiwanensis]GGE89614.1 hypothetical protein GCM10007285_16360 [Stappia taiwanensis]
MTAGAGPETRGKATNGRWQRVAAGAAILFGVVTVLAGGRVLFGGAEARAAAGDIVPFVLWFNFLAGFAYAAAGVGLWRGRRWAVRLSWVILAATLAVFAGFAGHILMGGAFEPRTLGAMTVRTLVWAGIVWTFRPTRGGNVRGRRALPFRAP